MNSNSIYVCSKHFSNKFENICIDSYLEFVESVKLPKRIKHETAGHHILPQWAFPEFKSFKRNPWNLAILAHKDHIIAHFKLWECWRAHQNASPLMLMHNISTDNWTIELIEKYAPIYEAACIAHGKAVSIRHTGKVVEQKSKDKSKETKLKNGSTNKGMVNCIYIESGESAYVSSEEYAKGKDIIYTTHNTGKPSWNLGIEMQQTRGKLSVILRSSGERVFITSDDYFANKEIYTHPSAGRTGPTDRVPVFDVGSQSYTTVTKEEYALGNHPHPASNTAWYNDGTKSFRLKSTDVVLPNYIAGRLKGDCIKKNVQILTCPHCGKSGKANMHRYHFDKCQHNADRHHSIL